MLVFSRNYYEHLCFANRRAYASPLSQELLKSARLCSEHALCEVQLGSEQLTSIGINQVRI